MRGAVGLTFLLAFPACAPSPADVPGAPPDAAPPDADPAKAILEHYDHEVRAFAAAHALGDDWRDWMLVHADDWAKAYVSGRTRRAAKVEVRYETSLVYDPPWVSEDEHMAALERMAELEYPGWDFAFRPEPYPEADTVAWLGASGTSYASGREVHLVYETVFAHEFGHTIGLRHHYCGGSTDWCPEAYPPSEDPCIMNRNGYSFGPTEEFLLLLFPRQDDAEIRAAISEILDRYPDRKRGKAAEAACATP